MRATSIRITGDDREELYKITKEIILAIKNESSSRGDKIRRMGAIDFDEDNEKIIFEREGADSGHFNIG